MDFQSPPSDLAASQRHAQVVTFRSSDGRYLNIQGSHVGLSPAGQHAPTRENLFLLHLHYLSDGSVRISNISASAFVSVGRDQILITAPSATPTSTFHFFFKVGRIPASTMVRSVLKGVSVLSKTPHDLSTLVLKLTVTLLLHSLLNNVRPSKCFSSTWRTRVRSSPLSKTGKRILSALWKLTECLKAVDSARQWKSPSLHLEERVAAPPSQDSDDRRVLPLLF